MNRYLTYLDIFFTSSTGLIEPPQTLPTRNCPEIIEGVTSELLFYDANACITSMSVGDGGTATWLKGSEESPEITFGDYMIV